MTNCQSKIYYEHQIFPPHMAKWIEEQLVLMVNGDLSRNEFTMFKEFIENDIAGSGFEIAFHDLMVKTKSCVFSLN